MSILDAITGVLLGIAGSILVSMYIHKDDRR